MERRANQQPWAVDGSKKKKPKLGAFAPGHESDQQWLERKQYEKKERWVSPSQRRPTTLDEAVAAAMDGQLSGDASAHSSWTPAPDGAVAYQALVDAKVKARSEGKELKRTGHVVDNTGAVVVTVPKAGLLTLGSAAIADGDASLASGIESFPHSLAATSSFTVQSTMHSRERLIEREVTRHELQRAVKYAGHLAKPGHPSSRGDPTLLIEYDGVVYCTDLSKKVAITAWRVNSPAGEGGLGAATPAESGDKKRPRLADGAETTGPLPSEPAGVTRQKQQNAAYAAEMRAVLSRIGVALHEALSGNQPSPGLELHRAGLIAGVSL
eukprot:1419558-Prymnesium_polylepis.1